MYPGVIPINAAANRPADGEDDISDVSKYMAKAVNPEKPGARRTQIFLMSTGRPNKRRTW
jgi:hypothetical protein